jgi:hypothetical protein
MPERRIHRSPLVARGPFVLGNTGVHVAHCATPEIARFLTISANYFDRLTAAARVCKGEYEQLPNPQDYPGYWALIELIDEYETALRGNSRNHQGG